MSIRTWVIPKEVIQTLNRNVVYRLLMDISTWTPGPSKLIHGTEFDGDERIRHLSCFHQRCCAVGMDCFQ